MNRQMEVWEDECIWMDGWMSRQMGEQMNRFLNDIWVEGVINQWIGGWLNKVLPVITMTVKTSAMSDFWREKKKKVSWLKNCRRSSLFDLRLVSSRLSSHELLFLLSLWWWTDFTLPPRAYCTPRHLWCFSFLSHIAVVSIYATEI